MCTLQCTLGPRASRRSLSSARRDVDLRMQVPALRRQTHIAHCVHTDLQRRQLGHTPSRLSAACLRAPAYIFTAFSSLLCCLHVYPDSG
ncbi:hypothetical protein L226DRAFT_220501 [Lentinus tigrinus ALCF2SS1-7]|uniref:uncharacterized protein n=1 Tax=Lentinus tigrinus ALCF2SS1-7 TaxID=1328758 RepID=UPI00116604CC|nr:hypothetical protein L226DRAFT_220501 [Lentinus tigrinus ALCF2SS1-7]